MRVSAAGTTRDGGEVPGGESRRGTPRPRDATRVALSRRAGRSRVADARCPVGARCGLLAGGGAAPCGCVRGVSVRGRLLPAVGVDPRGVRRDGADLDGRRRCCAPVGRGARAGDHRCGPGSDPRGATGAVDHDPRRGGATGSRQAEGERGMTWDRATPHLRPRRDGRRARLRGALPRGHRALPRAGVHDPRRDPLRDRGGFVARYGADAVGHVLALWSLRRIVQASARAGAAGVRASGGARWR